MRPSDLTTHSGRFWSPDSIWNQPVDTGRLGENLVGNASFISEVGALAPAVVFGYTRTANDLAPLVRVDLRDRIVYSTFSDAYDEESALLDGDGWDSLAAGLILEREILGGHISHAVACLLPDAMTYYGLKLWLAPSRIRSRTPFEAALIAAASTYGLVCVGYAADRPTIICERSLTSTSQGDPGQTYRLHGLGSTEQEIGFTMNDLVVAR